MLDALVRLIEHLSPAMRCSILLLEEDGATLTHGAAPSLPSAYCDAIDGLKIGPGVGSCGTAAFERRLTIVADIATHPDWTAYRDLALSYGLRACWSTPIASTTGDCLGTFAMYYDEPRDPGASELELIATAAILASAVIERERLFVAAEADHAALAKANEALADANRAKSDFLATVSHELRTPLNAIGGYADLLLVGVRGQLTPPQRADVERVQRSAQHLLGLINDILNFAKLESGQVDFDVDDLPVASLLDSLEELVRPQVDAKTLAYAAAGDRSDLIARGDPEKVRQVLLNLVTNAVKFTDPGGRISVECDGDDANVRIVVRDTGRGIPEEHLARIFDPFVQIDRERTPKSQQGVGLGLSISRDLARAMGGTLTAASSVGEGSAFTLTLPRRAAAINADRRPAMELSSAT